MHTHVYVHISIQPLLLLLSLLNKETLKKIKKKTPINKTYKQRIVAIIIAMC